MSYRREVYVARSARVGCGRPQQTERATNKALTSSVFYNAIRERWLDKPIVDEVKTVRLYKYYSFTGEDLEKDYNLDALKKGYWYFGTPDYRNDPFDCCPEVFESVLNRRFSEKQREELKKFGACCFSKTPYNLHLWALYAGSHSGFVLEFEIKEQDYYNMTQGGINLPVFDVIYVDHVPPLWEVDLKYIYSKQYFADDWYSIPEHAPGKQKDPLLWYLAHSLKQKSVWAAEDEVRMLLGWMRPSKDVPGTFEICQDGQRVRGYKIYYPKHCLKRCIAGSRISDKNLQILNSITDSLDIPLTRMVTDTPFKLKEIII